MAVRCRPWRRATPAARRAAGGLLLVGAVTASGLSSNGDLDTAGDVDPEAIRADGAITLNEVLYDAPGADGGREFVELHLAGATACTLTGLVLERGNGGRPDDWQRVWTGTVRDRLEAGGLFVIGGSAVSPTPDAVVELGLQNGPDACRLRRDGAVVDLLGWGDHTHAGYAESSPAPDVPAGSSLARLPDGADSDDNAHDWWPLATPSPGRPNRAPPPLRIDSPGHHSSGRLLFDLHIAWRLVLDQAAPAPIAAVSVIDHGDPRIIAGPAEVAIGELDAGEVAEGELVLPGRAPGVETLELVTVAGTSRDTLTLTVRVGPGPLRITEFMARPSPGSPEWVEVVNVSDAAVDLGRCALADARLEPVPLGGAVWWLEPGDVAVLAAAPLGTVEPLVLLVDDWPALNDGGDRVRVLDADGYTSDDVPYSGDWAPPGASLSRLALDLPSEERASWLPEHGGTPGVWRAPAASPRDGFLTVEMPATQDAPCIVRLAAPLRDGSLRLFRMDGRQVASVDGAALRGRTLWVWDRLDAAGCRLPPGLYLLDLAGEGWHDGRPVRARATVAWGGD